MDILKEVVMPIVVAVITSGLSIIGTIAGTNKYNERRRVKKLSIDEDFKKKKQIQPILESIKYELDADRAFNMVFTNGDVTLTGHHLKKLSVYLEATKEGFKQLGQDFQFIPTKFYDRILDALYESEEDYVLFNEFQQFDELAALHAQYNIKTMLKVKIKNEFGKWIGILAVAFSEEKILTEGEIAFVKMQAARLGQLK